METSAPVPCGKSREPHAENGHLGRPNWGPSPVRCRGRDPPTSPPQAETNLVAVLLELAEGQI